MAEKRKKYYLVDFEDGPQLIQGGWMTDDKKYVAWPPGASEMDGRSYDKYLQSAVITPEDSWKLHQLLRLRACSDDFSKVRLKLRRAEEVSETDLNTTVEQTQSKRRGTRKPHLKPKVDSSDDERESMVQKSKAALPKVPPSLNTLTFGSYKSKENKSASFVPTPSTGKEVPTLLENPDSKVNPVFCVDDSKPNSFDDNVNGCDDKLTACMPSPSLTDKISCHGGARKNLFGTDNQLKAEHVTKGSEERPKRNGSESMLKPSEADSSLMSKLRAAVQEMGSVTTCRDKTQFSSETINASGSGVTSGPASSAVKNISQIGNDSVPKSTAKSKALDLARKMDENDFRAYMILHAIETRQLLKELSTKVGTLSLSYPNHSKSQEVDEADAAAFSKEQDEQRTLKVACDVDSWTDFNHKLKSDKKYALAVAKELADCGIKDFGDFVRHALSCVISNALASEYSWCGKKGKRPFFNFYFLSVLNWTLSKLAKFPRKKDDIKIIAQNWLRLASQRMGGANFQTYRKPKPDESDPLKTPRKSVMSAALNLSSLKKRKGRASSTPKLSPVKKRGRKNLIIDSDNEFEDLDDVMNESDIQVVGSSHEMNYTKDEADSSFEDMTHSP